MRRVRSGVLTLGLPCYRVYEPKVCEVLRNVLEKLSVDRELLEGLTSLFNRLWSNHIKASRASLALRVFPDITEEELEEMVLIDAYINL